MCLDRRCAYFNFDLEAVLNGDIPKPPLCNSNHIESNHNSVKSVLPVKRLKGKKYNLKMSEALPPLGAFLFSAVKKYVTKVINFFF